MPVQVTHNNDGHFYTIDVDIAKEGAEVFDLSTYFKARVADNHTGLRVRWFWQGQIFNTVGKKPRVEGVVGQYSFKKGTNGTRDLVMSPDASAVAFTGDVNDCEPGGYATYYFPGQMFPQDGLFKGTIGLVDDSGETAHYTSVDIWFKVYPQAGGAQMGKACDFYIDELDKAIKEAEVDFSESKKSMQKVIDEFTTKITDLYGQLQRQGSDTQTLLETLEAKIKQDGLFTQAEAQAFENTIKSWIEQNIDSTYDTVADMREDANLKEGQHAKTLGYWSANDGGAADYKIVSSTDNYAIDLKNGLKAEQINSGENNYYDELNVTTERINDTDTYFVDIPKVDSHGQNITPYITQNAAYWDWNSTTSKNVLQPFNDKDRTPTEYARHAHTTLTVNGSSSVEINGNSFNEANVIGNGKVLRKWHNQTTMPDNFVYVCIMKDRSLKEYPNTATTDQMLADGVQDCWLSYWRLINNRQLVDNSKSVGNEGHTRVNDKNPHLGFGIMSDGTLVIAACDGRTTLNNGLTSNEFAQAMLDHGCVDAWHMDGGGSTSVTYKGSKINRNIDGDGTQDRQIPFTFNIKKPNANGGIADAFSQAGKVKQEVLKQIIPAINNLTHGTVKWVGQYSFKSDDELENWLTNDLPDLVSWYDYPAGCTLMGAIATQYQGSAPAKVIGYPNNADWFFKYETSGSHKWGTLTMQFGEWPTVKRNYQAPLTPKWTEWYSTEAPQVVTPKFVDTNIIKEFHAVQVGNAVQVNMKWEYGTVGTWKVAVTGLPFPALAMSLNAHDVIGSNGSRGRYAIYNNGQIGVNAWELPQGKTTDSFETSFVYLTGHATDAIKDAAKQDIPMGKNTDN